MAAAFRSGSRSAVAKWFSPSAAELLIGAARARGRALRDARIIDLAADYIVGIALLESLQAGAAASGRLQAGCGRE